MACQLPSYKITRQARFLSALLAAEGNKRAACKASGIPESTAYRWLKKDRFFNAEVSEAFCEAHQALLLKSALKNLSVFSR